MGQHGELRLFVPQGRDAKHRDSGRVDDTAAGGNLHMLRSRPGEIPGKREREYVYHCLARTGVQREIQSDIR